MSTTTTAPPVSCGCVDHPACREAGSRTAQELLEHNNVKTTIPARRDTHVLNRGPTGVRSPMDLP